VADNGGLDSHGWQERHLEATDGASNLKQLGHVRTLRVPLILLPDPGGRSLTRASDNFPVVSHDDLAISEICTSQQRRANRTGFFFVFELLLAERPYCLFFPRVVTEDDVPYSRAYNEYGMTKVGSEKNKTPAEILGHLQRMLS
jgi:hypothetical protein